MTTPPLSLQSIPTLTSLVSTNKALVVLSAGDANASQGDMQLGMVALSDYATFLNAGLTTQVNALVSGSTAAGKATALATARNINGVPFDGTVDVTIPASLANLAIWGYIDGFVLSWVSVSSIAVSAGAAFIPSLNGILQSTSTITVTGLTGLTASTFYHVYLYSNAGVPAVEVVTTAPVFYTGNARNKTGDNSRRYLGSIFIGTGGNVSSFVSDGRTLRHWVANSTISSIFEALTNGMATSLTTFSIANMVPVGTRVALLRVVNSSTTGGARPLMGTSVAQPFIFNLQETEYMEAPCDSSLQYAYYYPTASTTTGLYVDVHGYVIVR